MSQHSNEYQQPVGEPMPQWAERAPPPGTPLVGRLCRIERLNARQHADDLYRAYSAAPDGRDWTYMSVGPFADASSYLAYAERAQASADPLHFAVIEAQSGRAVGTLALMRIDRANGVVEVGHVTFSPLLKRTPISTEAQYLLMRHVFDELGYRRFEWKCDSLNAPSRKTALRLGFEFEGIFRQALVYKGRSRDTAWYSVIDRDWPRLRAAFEVWLAPQNFDADGQQLLALTDIRRAQSGNVAPLLRPTKD